MARHRGSGKFTKPFMLYLTSEQHEYLTKIANESFRGNLSEAVRALIDLDRRRYVSEVRG